MPSTVELLLALASRRGVVVTGHAPGAGVVVKLPPDPTFLDGVLASVIVSCSAEVLDLLAATAAAQLLAELSTAGVGGEPCPDP